MNYRSVDSKTIRQNNDPLLASVNVYDENTYKNKNNAPFAELINDNDPVFRFFGKDGKNYEQRNNEKSRNPIKLPNLRVYPALPGKNLELLNRLSKKQILKIKSLMEKHGTLVE